MTPTGGFAWARALEKDPAASVNFNSAARQSDATASPDASGAFVVKLTAAGDFAWAGTFGGPGTDSGGGPRWTRPAWST